MIHYFDNLSSVIKKYKCFNIPYYQRRYVWNKPENVRILYKFVDDICNAYKESEQSQYFIGSLAFCSHDGLVDVVDGQQRLTSLVMFLSLLADTKCSASVAKAHKSMVYQTGPFIINESYYLTAELEGVLGYKPYSGTGYKVKLDETVVKIKNLINRNLSTFTTSQFDSLYNYILNNVFVIGIEYGNVKDALRYFLNINSLSIELKAHEIFYTILSQSLVLSHNSMSINTIISEIDRLISTYSGFKKPEDIITIFIESYYSQDPNINELEELGVGRWMSYFHVDVFGDAIIADQFCKKFIFFLEDFEAVAKLFGFNDSRIGDDSPLYLSFCLLTYEKHLDELELFKTIFKNRHNYIDKDIYVAGFYEIDIPKLEEIARRLNLTVFQNYIKDCNKRLDGLATNIEVDSSGNYKLTKEQILTNINIENVFTLGYLEANSFQSNPKISVPDKSKMIRAIFALQQGFLCHVSNSSNSLYKYFGELVSGQKFTIEHLYSVKEFMDSGRLSSWQAKGMFANANEFDLERSKFENLTLLNFTANSSANDDPIYDKLNKYKNAHSVFTHEDEFLVQSLVPGSAFYLNSNIAALGLPNREITNISTNTWEHSSDNKAFIRETIKLALKEIFK